MPPRLVMAVRADCGGIVKGRRAGDWGEMQACMSFQAKETSACQITSTP